MFNEVFSHAYKKKKRNVTCRLISARTLLGIAFVLCMFCEKRRFRFSIRFAKR